MSNNSPAPGVPQSPTKAIWAALSSALVAGLLVLWIALDDNKVSNQEIVQVLLAFLGTPVAVGGVTYQATNKPTA